MKYSYQRPFAVPIIPLVGDIVLLLGLESCTFVVVGREWDLRGETAGFNLLLDLVSKEDKTPTLRSV